jgi:hypothetical protein
MRARSSSSARGRSELAYTARARAKASSRTLSGPVLGPIAKTAIPREARAAGALAVAALALGGGVA